MSVTLPIVEVVLSEDRAQVRRQGTVALLAGRNRITLEGVAPVLADRTVSVALSRGRVVEAHVERTRRVLRDAMSAEVRALDEKIDARQRERNAQFARMGLLREQLEKHGEAGDMAAAEIAQDAAWGDDASDAWTERMTAGRAAAWEVAEQLVRVTRGIERTDEELDDLRKRRALLDHPGSRIDARLHVTIESAEAGEAKLDVDYTVPSACWRPMHRARLVEGSETTVVFEHGAAIWQSTGEDWNGVRLVLSTERPSLGESPPTLTTDRVEVRKIGNQVVVESREQTIDDAGLGTGGAKRVVRELPGIDDGGEARAIRVQGAFDIPTDGRMHRVPLASFRSPASLRRSVAAELAAGVFLETVLHNAEREMVLPGPVELVRSGGIAGRTKVGVVAAGEKFRIGWGPDPALRVTRETDEEALDSTLLSGWIRQRRSVVVRVSNLGPDRVPVQVRERIPVSEIDKVKIELEPDRSTSKVQADGDGFVQWDRVLEPYGRAELKVSYILSRHPDVQGL
jgi:uncharacterized protein (TIGR02231 family)